MFCPIKNNKSRKASNKLSRNNDNSKNNGSNNNNENGSNNHANTNHHHGSNNNNNSNNNNTNNVSGAYQNFNLDSINSNGKSHGHNIKNQLEGDNQHAIISSHRYVTAEYHAVVDDELTVLPGDVVLYLYTQTTGSDSWSRVVCLKSGKDGFVPSEILSTDHSRNPILKKKVPQSINDSCHRQHPHLHPSPMTHHHHHHNHHHHAHKTPLISTHPSPTNGDTMCLHSAPRFSIPHSLEGSSGGKQSFQNFNSPAYYNVNLNSPANGLAYDQEFRPFHRQIYETCIVIWNFVAREENDLSVKSGDYVTVLNKDDEDWYWVRRDFDGAEGMVPRRFMCEWEHVKSIMNKGNSTVTMKSSNQNDLHIYINHNSSNINHRLDRESPPTDQHSSGP